MNIKKLFATLAGVSLFAQTVVPSAGVFGATYSQELQDAYNWAYWKGVTTMSSIDNANMYGAITRAEMAKMLSVYATEVLGLSADESKACNFTDIESVKGDLHDYIIKSCKLGIMGQGITAFRPYDTLSRAEFGTALSRVLWGNKYEGGTPYYANHLNALKAAGIMNQIANAEQTKEVRGYVMLMLMRSEASEGNEVDCDDPDILLACLDEDSDNCPAECKEDSNKEDNKDEDNDSNEKVRSGDLAVEATANKWGSVITDGATSELDTITFKASEDITLKSVTLERYGLSKYDSVESVWLENEDGVKITQEKTVSQSKDTVTLSIKKDYQDIEDGDSIVIVVTTPSGRTKASLGTNIGFKVIDVDSSAKNLDLSDYNPNLYDIIDYAGTDVKVAFKWSNKDYNYEEGKSYEIAKVKLTASNAAVLVNGLTLTQNESMDLTKFIDEVEVSVDGKVIKTKSSIKRDELKLTFDEQEIAINKSSTFTVSATLKDFDDLWAKIQLGFESASDVDILESKNKVRVGIYDTVNPAGDHVFTAAGVYGYIYTFNGGKITLTNTKLSSTIDAAAGSDDVVIASGKISIGGQPVSLKTLTVTPTTAGATSKAQYVDSLRLLVNDEEYEADKNWTFKNVVIEEDATIKLVADIIDLKVGDENDTITVSFKVEGGASAFNKTTWAAIKYDEIRGTTSSASSNLVGTINISGIKVQPAKWSLTNDATKKQEFIVNETSEEKLVFKGSYSAKKNNVNLDNVAIWRTSTSAPVAADDITFNVKIDGKTVASIDNPKAAANFAAATDDEDFSPVAVEAGKSVSVEVYAVVFASQKTTANLEYKIGFKGKDDAGNDAGNIDKAMAPMAFVDEATINVATNDSDSMKKQAIVLANKDQNLATFNVKPSNKDGTAKLESLQFILSPELASLVTSADADDFFEVSVWNKDGEADHTYKISGNTLTVEDIGIDISEETKVAVNFKEKLLANPTGIPATYETWTPATYETWTAWTPATCVLDGVDATSAFTDEASCKALAVFTTWAPDTCVLDGVDATSAFTDEASCKALAVFTAAVPGSCSDGTSDEATCPTVVKTPGSCSDGKSTTQAACEAAVKTPAKWTAADYTITLDKVNNWNSLGTTYKYTRKAVNSLVKVISMEGDKTSSTKYRFDVQYADDADNETISDFTFTYADNIAGIVANGKVKSWTNLQSDTTYTVDNGNSSNNVTEMTWTDGDGYVTTLTYGAGSEDYFKIKVWSIEDRIKAYKDSN